jgi:hypothetical protein
MPAGIVEHKEEKERNASSMPSLVQDAKNDADQTTLWCFALMLPFGYERKLLAEQYKQRVGLFACNGYVVYSNETIAIAAGESDAEDFSTVPIAGPLHVQYGGKWHSALNTDVFVRVWKAVASGEAFASHDWTAKVDPDTVFFPQRLRQLLRSREESFKLQGSVLLNNCGYPVPTLHGPIEVLSREAMLIFTKNISRCEGIHKAAMDMVGKPGDDAMDFAFGEDTYLRRCVSHLGIRRVDEFKYLLTEKFNCGKKPKDCSGASVAFHAYKTVKSWFQCWGFASVAHTWTLQAAVGEEVAAGRSRTPTLSPLVAGAALPSVPPEDSQVMSPPPSQALAAASGRQAPEAATPVEGTAASPVQLLPPAAEAVFPPDVGEPNRTDLPADNGGLPRSRTPLRTPSRTPPRTPAADSSASGISGLPQFHLPQFNFGRPPSLPVANITLLSGWPPQLGNLR